MNNLLKEEFSAGVVASSAGLGQGAALLLKKV